MPTITYAAALQAYDTINVAGRANDQYASFRALSNTVGLSALEQVQYKRETELLKEQGHLSRVAAARRGLTQSVKNLQTHHRVVNTFILSGTRLMLPLHVPVPAAYQQAWRALPALRPALPMLMNVGAPLALEALLGRGNVGADFPDQAQGRFTFVMNRVNRYGLLGAALEALPSSLAKLAHDKGYTKLACASMMAACLGRASLQVPRLVLMAWVLTASHIETYLALCVMVYAFAVISVVKASLLQLEKASGISFPETQLILEFARELHSPRAMLRIVLAAQHQDDEAFAQRFQGRFEDIHNDNRDRRTQAAVSALRSQFNVSDAAAHDAIRVKFLNEFPAFLEAVDANGELPAWGQGADARHLNDVRGAMHDGPGSISDTANTLVLPAENYHRESVLNIAALIWHGIDNINDERGPPFTDTLRNERRLALLKAMATGYFRPRQNDRLGIHVCAPGQVQNMVLVLQGHIGNFRIDQDERIETQLPPAQRARAFTQQALLRFAPADEQNPEVVPEGEQARAIADAIAAEAQQTFVAPEEAQHLTEVLDALKAFMDASHEELQWTIPTA